MAIIGDVFGLTSIYDRQVENIANDNFESWPPEQASHHLNQSRSSLTSFSLINIQLHVFYYDT